jgi:hypothetical protein
MKKNVLYLIILASILMLVGWTQIGSELDSQESMVIVSASYPRIEIPDYPADGKLFNDSFIIDVPSSARFEALDYRLDAEFFNEWYRDESMSVSQQEIPDYPLDAKLYMELYVETP